MPEICRAVHFLQGFSHKTNVLNIVSNNNITSEFNFHWKPYTSGLVPTLS